LFKTLTSFTLVEFDELMTLVPIIVSHEWSTSGHHNLILNKKNYFKCLGLGFWIMCFIARFGLKN
jgi:hypothetical protein